MRQDVSGSPCIAPLFRKQATRAAACRLFGTVTVVVPPSGSVALAIGTLAVLVLGCVAWFVEIPQRARAVGVLMPPHGFLNVVASTPGRVHEIIAAEGQTINAGEALLRVTTDQESMAALQIASLRSEIILLDKARAQQTVIDDGRAEAFDDRLQSISERLAVAMAEHKLQQQQIALLQRRLNRREGLASNGSFSADALDKERSLLLQARVSGTAMRRTVLDYEQEFSTVAQARAETLAESGRQQILHDLEHRRSQRQIEEYEQLVSQDIRAPGSGVVARIGVRRGDAVKPGDPLLTIYRPQDGLEAWLYLPSAKAGFLKAGQVVQLRLDAYPHQLFGTSSAVITSISSVAVVPGEINVPLALRGPVFEIRARLDDAHVKALETTWPLSPGASFQADLIQRRYKLYEWILRAVAGDSGDQRA